MSNLNFLSPKTFDFVHHLPLKSRFRGVKNVADILDIDLDFEKFSLIDPQELFHQLIKSPIELDLIQVFALMGWENEQWKSDYGHLAMKHWWLSVIEQAKKGDAQLRFVMILRSVLADTERYPAPKDVVQVMRKVMLELIQKNEFKDLAQLKVLQAILAEQPQELASIAIAQSKRVNTVVSMAQLPQKLPIIHEANMHWLGLWIEKSAKQRQGLRQQLNQLLSADLALERQYEYAQIILNHAAFSDQIIYLEKEVKAYPEIVIWLSRCARQLAFKEKLTLAERHKLNCWIGTGNYESLRSVLTNLAHQSQDEGDVAKTVNRYIFWKNYQHLFQEAWLLLPPELYAAQTSKLGNLKPVQGIEYPTIALKIGAYFVLQSFLGTAAKNDVLMTDDIETVENILHQKMIRSSDLTDLNLVLIHDHVFMWQSDLAYTLDQDFQMPAKDQQVYFAEGKNSFSNYLTDVKKSDFIHERKQWKNLPNWVKNSLKTRYPAEVYQRAALTALRYGLIHSGN